MIDEKLLSQLSSEDKKVYLETLQQLIEQTYIIESEYKDLKLSYDAISNILSGVIEFFPTAMWVLDEHGRIFLENTLAKELGLDFKTFKDDKEVELDDRFYLVKTSKVKGKTIISATDITEQKRNERLASMGQMAAHLAHEIRNPVGSVSILASTLYPMVNKKLQPIVDEIRKSIWRVERIIKATLLFTKGVAIKKSDFYLSEIREEMESSVGCYSYSKDINFIFELPNIQIRADFGLLCIIFQNLIFNAIDAIEDCAEESGEVKIVYFEDAKSHIFKFYDSGAPITNIEIIFDAFKTTKTKGNGLGLALSQQIAKAHGGRIYLCSEKKGFALQISR